MEDETKEPTPIRSDEAEEPKTISLASAYALQQVQEQLAAKRQGSKVLESLHAQLMEEAGVSEGQKIRTGGVVSPE